MLTTRLIVHGAITIINQVKKYSLVFEEFEILYFGIFNLEKSRKKAFSVNLGILKFEMNFAEILRNSPCLFNIELFFLIFAGNVTI